MTPRSLGALGRPLGLTLALGLCLGCVQDTGEPKGRPDAGPVDAFLPFDGAPVPALGMCLPGVPCGGQLVGSWRYGGQSCVVGEDESIKAICPQAGYELLVDTTGTLTFGLDGVYTNELHRSIGGTLVLPPECFVEGHADSKAQCELAGRELGTDSTCELDGLGGCICRFREASTLAQGSGLYSASGGELMMDTVNMQYCLRGQTLTIRAPFDSTGTLSVLYTLTEL